MCIRTITLGGSVAVLLTYDVNVTNISLFIDCDDINTILLCIYYWVGFGFGFVTQYCSSKCY